MNILPKKRWHVRTKENIARVRKDEAEAAEKERQENLRIDKAEREARLSVLKQKSKQKLLDLDVRKQSTKEETTPTTPEHINFFSDLEHAVQSTNKEHDKEFKDKKEEYEKQIGYLTYLGQDTNEALGKKNWYEIPPDTARFSRCDVRDTYEKLVLKDEDGKPKEKQLDEKDGEIAWRAKQHLDPLNTFKQYCSKNKIEKDLNLKPRDLVKVTKSKHKDNGKDSKNSLQKLREARLKREQQEKYKTQMFLSKLNGASPESSTENTPETIQPKYNSQFNPELARQNYR